MANAGRPVSQRQLRVGEMIKQSLSMIFLKDEAKIPDINSKAWLLYEAYSIVFTPIILKSFNDAVMEDNT